MEVLGQVVLGVVLFGVPILAAIEAYQYPPEEFEKVLGSSNRKWVYVSSPLTFMVCLIGLWTGLHWYFVARPKMRAGDAAAETPTQLVGRRMGFLSMGKKGERALAELAEEVEQRIAAGHSRFTVSLYCGSDGMTNMSIARMREAGQPFLLDLGVNVVDAEYEPWEYTMHYHIEVPERQEPEKQCPRCAETIKDAAVVCRFCGHEFG